MYEFINVVVRIQFLHSLVGASLTFSPHQLLRKFFPARSATLRTATTVDGTLVAVRHASKDSYSQHGKINDI